MSFYLFIFLTSVLLKSSGEGSLKTPPHAQLLRILNVLFSMWMKMSLRQEGTWDLGPFAAVPARLQLSSAQFSGSVVSDSLRPHESQHARPPCPSPISRSLLKPMSIESVMPSSHLILCRPLLLLPPIPSSIRVFSNESALRMRWPKY